MREPRRLVCWASRSMLGHRARRWQCILRPEPLPGDGLREGRKLEYSERVEALSAQLLLGRILINPVLSARLADVRFARSRAKSCHATIRRFVPPPPPAGWTFSVVSSPFLAAPSPPLPPGRPCHPP